MAKSLTDQILGVQNLAFEDVAVPEWKVEKLRITEMSGTARDSWERAVQRIENGQMVPDYDNFRGRLLVRCIVDPDTGERVFKDGHAEILGEKSAAVLSRLVAIAMRLNKLRKEDVEDLGKDSAPDQSADSGSG
jgi:hypothetical protein